jgi:hypothetical protein
MRPVIDLKPRHPFELANIVGDEHQAFAARASRDAPQGRPARANSARICPKCAAAFAETATPPALRQIAPLPEGSSRRAGFSTP